MKNIKKTNKKPQTGNGLNVAINAICEGIYYKYSIDNDDDKKEIKEEVSKIFSGETNKNFIYYLYSIVCGDNSPQDLIIESYKTKFNNYPSLDVFKEKHPNDHIQSFNDKMVEWEKQIYFFSHKLKYKLFPCFYIYNKDLTLYNTFIESVMFIDDNMKPFFPVNNMKKRYQSLSYGFLIMQPVLYFKIIMNLQNIQTIDTKQVENIILDPNFPNPFGDGESNDYQMYEIFYNNIRKMGSLNLPLFMSSFQRYYFQECNNYFSGFLDGSIDPNYHINYYEIITDRVTDLTKVFLNEKQQESLILLKELEITQNPGLVNIHINIKNVKNETDQSVKDLNNTVINTSQDNAKYCFIYDLIKFVGFDDKNTDHYIFKDYREFFYEKPPTNEIKKSEMEE